VSGLDAGRRPSKKSAQYILDGHIRILEALKEKNPEKAYEEVTKHILELEHRFEKRSIPVSQ
jgi:DNA-binding FadR family transcriptional regulator